MKNSNRILAIDLARGVSVLMVIIVHTLWIYGDIHTQSETWLGAMIHFIGKGTPMFLIAMGVSFTLSRNQSVVLSIKRAFYILAMGYSMNFLKFILPTLVGIIPSNFIEAYGWTYPATAENMIYMLGTGDILQLAGVSLLFMGVINTFSKNKYIPLIIALLIVLTTRGIHGFRLDIVGVDYVLDLLWGAKWNVYFAVFPWFSFILIGMFFGMWYKEKKNDVKTIFDKMGIGGILLMGIGAGLCYYNFEYHFGDYFHLGPGGTMYLAGFNLILMWVSNVLVTKVRENPVFNFFFYCSKRVTTIYMIQWILICWGMGFLGYQQFGVVGVLFLIPCYTIVILAIQKFVIDKLSRPNTSKKQSATIPKRGVTMQKT
ncbi:heparan-alpha-glucosaminide N-acetyltransferase domain-containing protein [Aquimarina sp. RZ0]|uniref:heparan-alpha-glucosaminide N-acetyltransferase domain-containing protein n=1 Tax=Aquimarina sp. RZ0 TaxID=2607730 RepID=UPI0011F40388|nr:heparan-alpha-glucosaminide N-acetyltransferase domain-containing protein [Aquimarina sp. RZ0]KAA1246370.1 DUF1624 domain-containing protein [Aquimarina sp. RZ0]